MPIRGKDILRKAVSRYLGQTTKLLRSCKVPHVRLTNYKEIKNPLQRSPKLKPKLEYCTLE